MALIIDIWFDGKTSMATNFIMVNNEIIHLATPIDASDALSKSYVDTLTNNLLKTDWTRSMCAVFNISNKKSIKLGKQIVMILQINHMCMVLRGNIGFEMGHDDKNETKF